MSKVCGIAWSSENQKSLTQKFPTFKLGLIVNGDAAESFRVQSVVKEELVHSMEEMLVIYIHLR
jgi:histone H3/H4